MSQKTYMHYKYIAISTAPAEKHVLCTRVIEGQTYLIGKTEDPNFVSISGKLMCSSGGRENVYCKHLHISRVKPFVKLIEVI